ncbi:MAG: hypothetical protein LUG66_09600, partial [Clostridiales bacterium]|nr:hypothetical protein [Clostridiales bacterium]
LQCSNPKTILEIIADVSAKSYAAAVLYQANKTEGINVNISTDELNSIEIKGNKLVNNLKNSSDTVKVIFTGLGITGIDVIPDGVFNIISSLATGLGVSLPIAATLVGGVFAVAAGTAIYRDLNKMQYAEYSAAVAAINSFYGGLESQMLLSYDKAMGMVKHRIEDNLIASLNLNQGVVKNANLKLTLARIDKVLDNIYEEVMKDALSPANIY